MLVKESKNVALAQEMTHKPLFIQIYMYLCDASMKVWWLHHIGTFTCQPWHGHYYIEGAPLMNMYYWNYKCSVPQSYGKSHVCTLWYAYWFICSILIFRSRLVFSFITLLLITIKFLFLKSGCFPRNSWTSFFPTKEIQEMNVRNECWKFSVFAIILVNIVVIECLNY